MWGTETSPTAEATPLPTPIEHHRDGEVDICTWTTDGPPVGTRYRLEWQFRTAAQATERAGVDLRRASDRMKAAGIIQDGDPVLREVAEPFDLPVDAEVVRQVIDDLFAAIGRVAEHHTFGKGMGLAAPQIGTGRAVAIVVPPGADAEPIVLIDPRVVDASAETDEQYEGCLSFFDVRGMVPRPRRIEVEHIQLDGQRVITTFTDAMARLAAHEIDHLEGHLYTDRMRDVTPIPVSEYQGTGTGWAYSPR